MARRPVIGDEREHDIIAIGASAGGVEAVAALLHALPADLPASVFVVVHRCAVPWVDGLPDVLQRGTALAVVPARNGDVPVRSRVYVAPPDQHLRIVGGVLRTGEQLERLPSRHGIDTLFRSAANAYGPRLVAVVLSGELDDGTAGLREVVRAGGIAIVQDPQHADHPSMPASALRQVPVDFCLAIPEIATTLVELVRPPIANARREA